MYSPFRKFGYVPKITERSMVFKRRFWTRFLKQRVNDSTFPFVRKIARRQRLIDGLGDNREKRVNALDN